MKPVVVTDAAFADLLAIGHAIGRDNPARALTFVDEIHERCLRLGETPLAFPLLPRWQESGVRRRPYRNYLIFYRVREHTVEFLHVLHGAMDYERILFDDA